MLLTNGRKQIFRELIMLSASIINSNLISRSISLAKVLWFGVPWLRGSFIALFCLWALVYLVDYATTSAQVVTSVMIAPIMLQTILGLYFAARAGQLLMNSQLHLVGVRKEIFLNCFVLCLFFVVFVYDPKNSDYLLNAKLIMFAVFGAAIFWMFWMYCLQLTSIIIVAVMAVATIALSFPVGVKTAFTVFNVVIWGYFAYWLWCSPLQRQFKFENFTGFVDYSVERLRITSLKHALTRVNNKEHVLLMGEGDGYFNRIILAPIFSLAFTLIYVVAMQSMRELCLWMILLVLNGTKAKIKITQSHAKLWLLNGGDRIEQFKTVENLSFRLNVSPFLAASLLLIIWIMINPSLFIHGIAALCISFLLITATDYYTGLIMPANKASLMVLVFLKMGLMAVITFMQLDILWYLLIAIVLLSLCVVFRKRAQRDYLCANLSVRIS